MIPEIGTFTDSSWERQFQGGPTEHCPQSGPGQVLPLLSLHPENLGPAFPSVLRWMDNPSPWEFPPPWKFRTAPEGISRAGPYFCQKNPPLRGKNLWSLGHPWKLRFHCIPADISLPLPPPGMGSSFSNFYFPSSLPCLWGFHPADPKPSSQTPRTPRKEGAAGAGSRSSTGTKVILCIMYLSWKTGSYSGYPRIQVLKPTLSQQHLE